VLIGERFECIGEYIRELKTIIKRQRFNMKTKYTGAFSLLIVILTICSCSNTDNGKNIIKSAPNFGGTYSFGSDVEKGPVGSVIVYPQNDNSALFFLDVCKGAPSYNLGQLFGQMTMNNDIGTYDSKADGDDFNCMLKFKFTSGQLEVMTEAGHDDCGFGGNVHADHKYKLIDKSIPKYFVDGEGDTILFSGLTVEKYQHRFD